MSDIVKIGLAFVLIIGLLALGPWLVIWSWNVLFGTLHTIQFGFDTWCAVILLGTFFRANVSVKRKD